jgi:hypothetical protein
MAMAMACSGTCQQSQHMHVNQLMMNKASGTLQILEVKHLAFVGQLQDWLS